MQNIGYDPHDDILNDKVATYFISAFDGRSVASGVAVFALYWQGTVMLC